MADEETSETAVEASAGKIDSWYEKIMGYITNRISSFVAFLFFLFAIGAVFGICVAMRWPHLASWIVIIPAVIGLIAYYNRTFATVMFFLLLVFVFI